MKMLGVGPFYYPAIKYAGPIFSQHTLNKQLVKKGVEIDILTTNGGLDNSQEYPLGTWENLDGMRVKRFNYFGYEHFTFSPGILVAAMKEAKKYDLIQIGCVWNFPIIAGSLSGLWNKVPYVITPRGNLYEEVINLKSKKKKQICFRLYTQFCLKNAAAIHYTTKDEQEKVSRYLNIRTKPMLIPNGLDLEEFRNLPEKGSFINKYPQLKGKRYILFFGRISKKKGLDILVNAFHKLTQSYKDIYLVIVGPDNEGYASTIKKMLEEQGIANQTIFTGMLSGDERFASLVDCELFVLSSYSENFGMSVVEAMACGVPVVISNNVGIYN